MQVNGDGPAGGPSAEQPAEKPAGPPADAPHGTSADAPHGTSADAPHGPPAATAPGIAPASAFGTGQLFLLSDAVTRSYSAENRDGRPGGGGRAERGDHSTVWASRELPVGWKKSPCIDLAPRSRRTVCDIPGPGIVQHVWITVMPEHLRSIVLRWYRDDSDTPAVEAPLGDLFCQGWSRYVPVISIPVTVAPAGGLNSYWPMPFHRWARLEAENLTSETIEGFFYQVTVSQQEISSNAALFHAQWYQSGPTRPFTDDPHYRVPTLDLLDVT